MKAVIDDIRGHGNQNVMLPGEPKARAAKLSDQHGGLLFSAARDSAFAKIGAEAGVKFDRTKLREVAE